MKLAGKSKTEFVPAIVGATATTGAGLVVPVSSLPRVENDAQAVENDTRPWLTVEELYAQVRENSKQPISRGRFKAQLRKAINRGFVEIQYPTKEAHSYGAQTRVRVTPTGREEANGAQDQPAADAAAAA